MKSWKELPFGEAAEYQTKLIDKAILKKKLHELAQLEEAKQDL